MHLFASSYVEHLIEIGHVAARRQADDLTAFHEQVPRRVPAQPPTEAARGEAA